MNQTILSELPNKLYAHFRAGCLEELRELANFNLNLNFTLRFEAKTAYRKDICHSFQAN